MEEKIVLDQESFKALSGSTRVKMLKLLGKRRHTQSEIAHELDLSVPTVREHLKELEKADMVRLVDEGRKWKYYELTAKAKGVLDPDSVKIWVLLSTMGFMALAGAAGLVKQLVSPAYPAAQRVSVEAAQDSLAAVPANASVPAAQGFSFTFGFALYLLLFVLLAGALAYYWVKRRRRLSSVK